MRRAMLDVCGCLLGELVAALGSFDGMRDDLAGEDGVEVTTGASTSVGSSLTKVPWRSGNTGIFGVALGDVDSLEPGFTLDFMGVLSRVFVGLSFALAGLLKPGLAKPDFVVRLVLLVRTCVFVTMFEGDVRGVSNLAIDRFGGDGVVVGAVFSFRDGGETLVVVFRYGET